MKTLPIDIAESVINWKAYKAGGLHVGTLKFKSGEVNFEEDKPVGGSFIIDMTTIHNSDQEGLLKSQLETHLKSTDFFNIEQFPEAKFVIEKTDHTPDDSGFYGVTGMLTIKDIKNEISFKATILTGAAIYNVQTRTINLDRTKWGITYGSKNIFKKMLDHVIADVFDVEADIVIKNQ